MVNSMLTVKHHRMRSSGTKLIDAFRGIKNGILNKDITSSIYKAKKETPHVNFLTILYSFEAFKLHLLFKIYCFSLKIYHQPFRNRRTIK